MTMSFRRYIALDVLILAATNSTFNAGYAWWLWSSSDAVQLTGDNGIAANLATTPIWIAVLTTLLGTAAVQRKLWEGRFREPAFVIPRLLGSLPGNIAARSMTTGLAAATVLALPLWMLLQRLSLQSLPFEHAIIIKVVLTVLFTACIVPLVVLAATADMQGARENRRAKRNVAR